MKRREFLNLGGATVVAGSVGVLPAQAATFELPNMSEVFERFDQRIQETRASFGRVREPSSDPVLFAGLDGLWTSLVAYSAFLELPILQQVHPGMQQRIRSVANALAHATDGFVATLKSDDPALWERLEHGRTRLPETQSILDGFDTEARRLGVSPTARRRFHALLRRSIRELRTRELRVSTQELVTAATGAEAPRNEADAATIREVQHAQQAWLNVGVEDEGGAESAEVEKSTHRGARILGLTFMIVGSTVTFIGLLLAVAYYQCFCIGALIALIGLGFLIPGIIIYTNAIRKDNEAAGN